MKNADALAAWAWKEGKEGRDFRATRDTAASIGTLAHGAVEAWIRKRPWEWPDTAEATPARMAFGAFLSWAEMSRLVVTETEVRMVSETLRLGGTADGVTVLGQRAILDWKSSSGLYPDHLVQIRGYGGLWNETHPDDPVVGGYHLVRFDKVYGDFHHHYWSNLDEAWDALVALRRLYDLEKILKARAK
jgi:hypothetical protein